MMHHHLTPELQQVVARAFEGIKKHRDLVIMVGGLAKFYYRLHPEFVPPRINPRATVDLDLALTRKAMDRRRELHEGLVSNQLVPFIVNGLDGNPIEMQYQRIEDGSVHRSETCVEFVVPYIGKSPRQKTSNYYLLPSALRYVELLLVNPIQVEDSRFGTLLLPHPLSYIAQKTLIRARRPSEKQARDQADCVYVAWGFQPQWQGWMPQWETLCAQPGRKRWLLKCRHIWSDLYRDADARGSREVEQVYSQLDSEPFGAPLVARIMHDFMKALPL